MSKIYLVGDCHLGLGFPNKSEKWNKVHKEYFNDFLIPLLEDKIKPGDIIVQLGDLFDNRNVIPIDLFNYGMDIVERLAKIAPLHILIGNHDLWSKSTSEINSIRPFRYIPNVSIYDRPEKIEFNGKSILMLPYIEKRKDQIDQLKKFQGADYLFCHSDLNGAKMHLTSVAHRNNDKIEPTDFKGYKNVKTGHIHLVQKIDQITFVGSIFQMDRNDYGDQKGIFVIDTDTEEETFIKNDVSPVFKKVKITQEENIEILEELKDSKDYIDISISNSLLINNRKLRRKLEILLEKNKFESVQYIDDITTVIKDGEEVTINEATNDKEIDISIQLDYEDYIKEFISNQTYDNDKFKESLLLEYGEIIRIYKENYQND